MASVRNMKDKPPKLAQPKLSQPTLSFFLPRPIAQAKEASNLLPALPLPHAAHHVDTINAERGHALAAARSTISTERGHAPAVPSLEELNSEQRLVAEHGNGFCAVEAGPGSGKTRVITTRIAHLHHSGVPAWRVLGLTFSRKAAAEMATRLGMAGRSGGSMISTFHSFCAWVLRKEGTVVGVQSNFRLLDEAASQQIVRELLQCELDNEGMGIERSRPSEDNEGNERGGGRSVSGVLAAIQAIKRQAAMAAMRSGHIGACNGPGDGDEARLQELTEAYCSVLAERHALDYDDLLLRAAAALALPEVRPACETPRTPSPAFGVTAD